MRAFIVSALFVLLVIAVFAAIVYFILQKIGVPQPFLNFVWAGAALVFLIWLLNNISAIGVHL
jgi:hypothetical protein